MVGQIILISDGHYAVVRFSGAQRHEHRAHQSNFLPLPHPLRFSLYLFPLRASRAPSRCPSNPSFMSALTWLFANGTHRFLKSYPDSFLGRKLPVPSPRIQHGLIAPDVTRPPFDSQSHACNSRLRILQSVAEPSFVSNLFSTALLAAVDKRLIVLASPAAHRTDRFSVRRRGCGRRRRHGGARRAVKNLLDFKSSPSERAISRYELTRGRHRAKSNRVHEFTGEGRREGQKDKKSRYRSRFVRVILAQGPC